MVKQELITTIKRLGIESGKIGIFYSGSDPIIFIEFYDEDTGEDHCLEWIELGELSFIKESNVIGNINLENIKTSDEAKKAKALLYQQGEELKPALLKKAKKYAKEITRRAGIPVEVLADIQGEPSVMTVHERNMWHASEIMEGIEDDC